MWMITGKDDGELCSIHKNLENAQKYLANTFVEEFVKLQEIPANDYPLFMVWDFNQKTYYYADLDTLGNKLFHIEKVEDDDETYFIIDIFSEDFEAFHPDDEAMKLRNHIHVTNNAIEVLIEEGLKARSTDIVGNYRCCDCNLISIGTLTKKGYEPPNGWQIVALEGSEELITLCSEKCKCSYFLPDEE